ncbi:hypothetical protein JD844_032115 [Phrynosoma platyrhinos]|uniref:thioredoxin-dependent peroxiredoxin n=1 Tax=Phrynosoma platyrhinos TaxID=52577 RepID=A0ABQ7T465_PHRPL|nr:hypothetical protein JD844_032115 [Phrynosoma platyrhinos]
MNTKKMVTSNVQIGKPVPDFHTTAVVDGAFKELNLSDCKGKYVVGDGELLEELEIRTDKGIMQQITISDLPMGHSVDETLHLVQAFQFTNQHGEVCPAVWEPDGDTIKPTMEDSKVFFVKKQ